MAAIASCGAVRFHGFPLYVAAFTLVSLSSWLSLVDGSHLSDIAPSNFYQWPNGATIESHWKHHDRQTVRVQLPNGTRVDHEFDVGQGGEDMDMSTARAKSRPSSTGSHNPDYYSGWVEYSGFLSSGNVTHMYARWVVPPVPPHYNILTTVFLFAGLEANAHHDVNDIMQPVLQYGHSGCGGGKHWSAASFYVVGITAHCGETLRAEPGDIIEANMTQSAADQVWTLVTTVHSMQKRTSQTGLVPDAGRVHAIVLDSQDSVLHVKATHAYHWAVVTLEAIRVYSCSTYPGGNSTEFSDIVVEVDHVVVQEPRWNKTVNYHDCGQGVDIINAQTSTVYYDSSTFT